MKKENQFIRLILKALFLNNLVGILLYLPLTFISVIFVMGIPGLVFFIVLSIWLYKNKSRIQSTYIVSSIGMIPYNFYIYQIAKDIAKSEKELASFEVFAGFPEIFPLINVCLLGLLLLFSLYYSLKPEETVHEDLADY